MKETKVYIIDCSECDDFRKWEQEGNHETIMLEAKKQGNVYSLEYFEDEINSENLDLNNSFIWFSNKFDTERK